MSLVDIQIISLHKTQQLCWDAEGKIGLEEAETGRNPKANILNIYKSLVNICLYIFLTKYPFLILAGDRKAVWQKLFPCCA